MTQTLSLVDAMDHPALFGRWFSGPSWDAWRAVLRGAFGMKMSDQDLAIFRELADRDPPTERVRECWIIAGRRAGKDSAASLLAAYTAALIDHRPLLRPGERASILCLAVDRAQARIVFGYTKAYFENIPPFGSLVTRETADGLELSNGAEIIVATNDYRAVRGRSVALCIMDECALWRDEASTTPDRETYNAVMPSMATIPTAMLIGISSPYRRSGLLYEKFKKHYGQPGNILVIKAPSRALNPTLDQRIIDEAMALDPEAASAEWLGEFRNDIAAFISRELVESCVDLGCHERPPNRTVVRQYHAFIDAAGGTGSDSMCLGISHSEGDTAVLDVLRERRPPFSPDEVTREFAEVMKSYGIQQAESDKWGGDWVGEAFRKHNIRVNPSAKPKSDLYKELLSVITSGRCSLLDNQRLIAQFAQLERRVARGGRDSIDHPAGAAYHDDCSNVATGALLLCKSGPQPLIVADEVLAMLGETQGRLFGSVYR